MAIGDVKWFNRAKGFGFICPDTGPCDVFVHISAVHHSGIEMLFEGQRIEFELTQLADGRLSAFGLRPVELAETPELAETTETPPAPEHQTQ